jgi:hypothetical protein
MFTALRTFARTRTVLKEIRALRQAAERIANAMEFANQATWPVTQPKTDELQDHSTDIGYISDAHAKELMDIELELTAATGQPPSEDATWAEFERRHPSTR